MIFTYSRPKLGPVGSKFRASRSSKGKNDHVSDIDLQITRTYIISKDEMNRPENILSLGRYSMNILINIVLSTSYFLYKSTNCKRIGISMSEHVKISTDMVYSYLCSCNLMKNSFKPLKNLSTIMKSMKH